MTDSRDKSPRDLPRFNEPLSPASRFDRHGLWPTESDRPIQPLGDCTRIPRYRPT